MYCYTIQSKTFADPYWSVSVDVVMDDVAIDGVTLRTGPATEGSADLYSLVVLAPHGVRFNAVAEDDVIADLSYALEHGASVGETWTVMSNRRSLPQRVSGPDIEEQEANERALNEAIKQARGGTYRDRPMSTPG